MQCLICGLGPQQGTTVFRQNPKGQPGVWACAEHNEKPIDPLVKTVVDAVEGKEPQKEI